MYIYIYTLSLGRGGSEAAALDRKLVLKVMQEA